MKKKIIILLILSLAFVSSASSANSLDLYFPFNSSSATDYSGNGFNGTLNGGINTSGVSAPNTTNSGSYNFDGADDYVEVTSQSQFDVLESGNNASISFWIRPETEDVGVGQHVYSTDGEFAVKIFNQTAGDSQVSIRADLWGDNTAAAAVEEIPVGEWSHIVVNVDTPENNITFYRNGEYQYSYSSSDTSSDNGNNLFIGAREGTFEFFDGDIDEIRLHNEKLDSTQIENLYSCNSLDCGGNNDPSLSNPSPSDGATDVSNTTSLSVDYNDVDGDTGYVEFYNGTDNSLIENVTGVSSGSTASTSSLSLDSNTTVTWYAEAYDGNGGSTSIGNYSFTTSSSSSSFTGSVEDFEDGDLNGWYTWKGAGLSNFNTVQSPAIGDYSVEGEIVNGNNLGILYNSSSQFTPSSVEVKMRAGYVGDSGDDYRTAWTQNGDIASGGYAFGVSMNGDGIYSHTGSQLSSSISQGTWYHIEFSNINWSTHNVGEISINGTVEASNVGFTDNIDYYDATVLDIFSPSSFTTQWDDVSVPVESQQQEEVNVSLTGYNDSEKGLGYIPSCPNSCDRSVLYTNLSSSGFDSSQVESVNRNGTRVTNNGSIELDYATEVVDDFEWSDPANSVMEYRTTLEGSGSITKPNPSQVVLNVTGDSEDRALLQSNKSFNLTSENLELDLTTRTTSDDDGNAQEFFFISNPFTGFMMFDLGGSSSSGDQPDDSCGSITDSPYNKDQLAIRNDNTNDECWDGFKDRPIDSTNWMHIELQGSIGQGYTQAFLNSSFQADIRESDGQVLPPEDMYEIQLKNSGGGSASDDDIILERLEIQNVSKYRSSGEYVDTLEIGGGNDWLGYSIDKTVPSGTSVDVDWGQNSSGTWTRKDSLSDVNQSDYLRYYVELETTNSSKSPYVNDVKVFTDSGVWSENDEDLSVINDTEQFFSFNAIRNTSLEYNVEVFDSSGSSSFSDSNQTVQVTSVDDPAPSISIGSPLNQTYNTDSVDLNVSSSEAVSTWEYSLDGSTNTTFTPNTTISGLSDGSHTVDVYATDSSGNTGSESVSFTVNTENPSFSISNPLNGDNYNYQDTETGADIKFSGSVDTSFTGSLDLLVDGSSVYTESISSGSNSYSYSQEFTQGTYDTTLEVTSDNTANTYTSNTNTFTVDEVSNPPPVINKTVYNENVSQHDSVDFNLLGSDYTDNLDSYSFKAKYNGSTVDSSTGSLSTTNRWINVTDLFTAEKPGTYIIQATLTDNNDITTTENFNVNVQEGNVDFNLKQPNDTVETGGEIDYNTSFQYDVDLPSNGLVTLYISEPGQSDFVADGSESLQGITYTGREIINEFNNISYSNIAGEDYRASGTYDWYLEYESSASGNVYTSTVNSWQFIDTPETTDTTDEDDDGGLFAGLTNIIYIIGFVLLLALPVWIKIQIDG